MTQLVFPFLILGVFNAPRMPEAMVISDTLGEFQPFHLKSPIFNRNIGRKKFDPVVGPLVITRNFGMCHDLTREELGAFAKGKVVLIDRYDGQFWDMNVGKDHAECLAAVGAQAAIKAYHIIKTPG